MSRPAKTLVIMNPAAGGRRGAQARAGVAAYLRRQGFHFDLVPSESSNDLRRRAAEAATAGYERLVSLGGDGTFLHLVNGAYGHDLELGILPVGNGNDVALGLGLPADPIEAAQVLLTGAPHPVDVVRALFAEGRTELYVGGGGMGLDAEAARLANGRFRRLPGVTRYVAGALWSLATFQPLQLDAELDCERANGPVLFAAVANAPVYGSGVRIAPEARMDDGWLDVTLVGTLPWTRLLEAIPVMLQTGNLDWPEIRRYRARRIRLRADRPALFHGDGELLGCTPVELEVLPGAIRVVVPPRK